MTSDFLPRADLLDPSFIASLGDIEITSRWIVDGFLGGLHRSPRRGSSVEFAGHRSYQAGDEPRHVDWRVAARGDRLVVKEFEAETNLTAMIAVDLSASMCWTGDTARLTKADYARRCAAALSLLLIGQRDSVGLLTFGDGDVDAVAPRSQRAHWRRLAARLSPRADARAGSRSEVGAALDHASRMLRRSGLIVLLSDLLSDDDLGAAVRASRARGHDVLVLHVMDPVEREFDFDRAALFTDPESGDSVGVVPSDVRAAYVATVQAVLAEWRTLCASVGAEHVLVDTSEPFGLALRAAFARRERAA